MEKKKQNVDYFSYKMQQVLNRNLNDNQIEKMYDLEYYQRYKLVHPWYIHEINY